MKQNNWALTKKVKSKLQWICFPSRNSVLDRTNQKLNQTAADFILLPHLHAWANNSLIFYFLSLFRFWHFLSYIFSKFRFLSEWGWGAVCLSFRWTYLQAGEEVRQLDEKRQKDESDESCLRRRLIDFVPVHEGGDGETLQLLHVTLTTPGWS